MCHNNLRKVMAWLRPDGTRYLQNCVLELENNCPLSIRILGNVRRFSLINDTYISISRGLCALCVCEDEDKQSAAFRNFDCHIKIRNITKWISCTGDRVICPIAVCLMHAHLLWIYIYFVVTIIIIHHHDVSSILKIAIFYQKKYDHINLKILN